MKDGKSEQSRMFDGSELQRVRSANRDGTVKIIIIKKIHSGVLS